MSESPKPVIRLDPPDEHNRRNFGRISPYWVKCDQGFLLDISASGMKLLTTKKLKDPVSVRLWDAQKGIQVQGRVCWTRRIRFRQHESGIHFTGLDDQLRDDLAAIAAQFHDYPS